MAVLMALSTLRALPSSGHLRQKQVIFRSRSKHVSSSVRIQAQHQRNNRVYAPISISALQNAVSNLIRVQFNTRWIEFRSRFAIANNGFVQIISFFRYTAIVMSLCIVFALRAASLYTKQSALPLYACISSVTANVNSNTSDPKLHSKASENYEESVPVSDPISVVENVNSVTFNQNVSLRAENPSVPVEGSEPSAEDGNQTDGDMKATELPTDGKPEGSVDEFTHIDRSDDEECDEFDHTLVDTGESSKPPENVLGECSATLKPDQTDNLDELESRASTPYKLTVPLRIVGLRGSVPPTWIKDFIACQSRRARSTVEFQAGLQEIYSALASAFEKKDVNRRSIIAADAVTIGNSWLELAISRGLIDPIENVEQYDWFNNLSPIWQAYLRRDTEGRLSSQGLVWGVPYRWGSMVIAFRKDKLIKNNIPPIEDWDDLWRPELAGKISMVGCPREVVGAVLKSLGASYNTQEFDKDVKGGKEAIRQQLLKLKKQVKVFDNVHYIKALSSEDVWVAVGWSSDVIPVAKRMSNMRVVVPKSGASLWADIWAIPAATAIPTEKIGSRVNGASPLVHQWFEFCLQPARAEPFRQGVIPGASPLDLQAKWKVDQDPLKDTIVAIASSGPKFDSNLIEGKPPVEVLEKCEFLQPLSEKAISDYEWLFKQASAKTKQA